MAKKKAIPNEVREQIETIIDRFNEVELNSPTEIYAELHEQNLNRAAAASSFLGVIQKLFSKREEFINYKFYTARYRGKFLYLDINSPYISGPVCRLEYTGDMKAWNLLSINIPTSAMLLMNGSFLAIST